jgi:hypothetical protein
LQIIILPLFLANTINIGADLSGMADAARLLLGGPAFLYVLAFGLICVLGVVFVEYSRYVMVLKWLTLSLFAYVGTLFAANVPWPKAISGLLPQFNWNTAFLTTLVAILGTTISPYLFFWQASQEAEDVKTEKRRKPLLRAPWQAVNEFTRIRTLVGMAFSNLIALSIMITTAATLNQAGIKEIATSAQAAEALKPIAGEFASFVFAVGIIGTGLLAVPVLAGSAAYAIGEAWKWPIGLSKDPEDAVAFYRGRCRGSRDRAHIKSSRPDQGFVLGGRDQRRSCRSRHDGDDVDDAREPNNGEVCHHGVATLARLGLNCSHGCVCSCNDRKLADLEPDATIYVSPSGNAQGTLCLSKHN